MAIEQTTGKLLKFEVLLLLTAAIWGFAFVAQRAGMEHIGAFTFNAVRFALGSLFLVPLLVTKRRRGRHLQSNPVSNQTKMTILSGGFAGLVLFAGASFQQIGIVYTTAGKAGFITGLYVVIVPVLGLLWSQRPGRRTWSGAFLAVLGLYLLSVSGRLSISRGDLLVLISAFFWAGHVLIIGWFSPKTDSVTLACLQFATCSVLSLVAALATEVFTLQGLTQAIIPVLYAGLLSTGVAYTLQVVAQGRVPTANAAIIMSFEAVFAVLGGWLILKETIPLRGLLGCTFMLIGMLISQLDPKTVYRGDSGGRIGANMNGESTI